MVLEASGGPEVLAASELHAAGLTVAVVNPRQAREFARSLGTLGKTDRLDAIVLAQFAQSSHSHWSYPVSVDGGGLVDRILWLRKASFDSWDRVSKRFFLAITA